MVHQKLPFPVILPEHIPSLSDSLGLTGEEREGFIKEYAPSIPEDDQLWTPPLARVEAQTELATRLKRAGVENPGIRSVDIPAEVFLQCRENNQMRQWLDISLWVGELEQWCRNAFACQKRGKPQPFGPSLKIAEMETVRATLVLSGYQPFWRSGR